MREAGIQLWYVPAFPPLKPGGRRPTGSVFAADAARGRAAGEANVSVNGCAVHGLSVGVTGLGAGIIS
jgi:hypothetical protein